MKTFYKLKDLSNNEYFYINIENIAWYSYDENGETALISFTSGDFKNVYAKELKEALFVSKGWEVK